MALVEYLVEDILKVPGIPLNDKAHFKILNVLNSKVFQPYNWDKRCCKFVANKKLNWYIAGLIITLHLVYFLMTMQFMWNTRHQIDNLGSLLLHVTIATGNVVVSYCLAYHFTMHPKIINFLNSALQFNENSEKESKVTKENAQKSLEFNEKVQLAMCVFFRMSSFTVVILISGLAVIAPKSGINQFELLDEFIVPFWEGNVYLTLIYRVVQFVILFYSWHIVFPMCQLCVTINMFFAFIFFKTSLHKLKLVVIYLFYNIVLN